MKEIPQVQVLECVVQQIMAVAQILEHSVEAMKEIREEQLSRCVGEHIGDVAVPDVMH